MNCLAKVLLLFIVMTNVSIGRTPIVIGSKNFSESIILAEMVAAILEEKYDLAVTRKMGLGGTKVAFDALKNGSINIYPDYTGTGYSMILKLSGTSDPAKVYQEVYQQFKQRWGIIWSKSLGFNNTYALAVRADDERFKDIQKISQISGKVKAYTYAAAYEFMERKDGHREFTKTYNLNFDSQKVISMGAGLMYSAIRDKKVDMIVAYSTDGRIEAYHLRKLVDDKKYFPPYQVALLAKENTLKQFPEVKEVFKLLHNFISEEEMIAMNNKVDHLKFEPKDVARNFLIEKGVLQGKKVGESSAKNLVSFFIYKRKYLLKIIGEHLLLCFFSLTLAFFISIPTGILLTRYSQLAKIVFPIVNTVQTIPSLALLGFLIPLLGIGVMPAILALFLYSLLPLVRNTYTGILSVDKNYIEASKGIGLTNFQILIYVEIPLALPIIIAGLRTAVVIVIGTATLAALIGAGGLGDPIFRGVATVNSNLILLGAIPSAVLAVVGDKIIGISEKFLVSKGIRN